MSLKRMDVSSFEEDLINLQRVDRFHLRLLFNLYMMLWSSSHLKHPALDFQKQTPASLLGSMWIGGLQTDKAGDSLGGFVETQRA